MAPWLWLAGYDPVGPAVAVAWLGVITVPLLYVVGKKFVEPTAAFLATLLYATAPYVLAYTRFSWNPNPAPVVTLGMMYAGYRAWKGSAWWWLGVVLGWLIIIQLHYVLLVAALWGIVVSRCSVPGGQSPDATYCCWLARISRLFVMSIVR